MVLPCLDHISQSLNILDRDGQPTSIFNENLTGPSFVWIKALVSDPFGAQDITATTIAVTDRNGVEVINEQPVSFDSSGSSFYLRTYIFNAQFPIGFYTVTIKTVDSSANAYYRSENFLISNFYRLKASLLDEYDEPLSGANYTISSDSVVYAKGYTNASGWIERELPSSDVVGRYNIGVLWKNIEFTPLSRLTFDGPTTLTLKVNVFNVEVKCVLYGIPLSGASMSLVANSCVVDSAVTGLDGSGTKTLT